jgi:vancomycin resistance protein VanJ
VTGRHDQAVEGDTEVGTGAAVADQRVEIPRQLDRDTPESVEAIPQSSAEEAAAEVVEDLAPEHPSTRHGRAARARHELNLCVVVLASLCAAVVLLHRFVPDSYGAGSLIDTSLPWLWVPIVFLVLCSFVARRTPAICVALVAAVAWAAFDGRPLLPRSAPAVSASAERLRIMSQNVSTTAPDLEAVGQAALASHVGVLALEDVYQSVAQSSQAQWLDTRFTYHVTMYEFGVWSAYPIENATPISDGANVVALRATVTTPAGDFVLYVVHLPPATLDHRGFARDRDTALARLVTALDAEPASRLAVVGTLNIASSDREMGRLTGGPRLTSVQSSVGSGFGFTWPAQFPMMRLDDVLFRGLTPVASSVLSETGTTSCDPHRPIYAELALQ